MECYRKREVKPVYGHAESIIHASGHIMPVVFLLMLMRPEPITVSVDLFPVLHRKIRVVASP